MSTRFLLSLFFAALMLVSSVALAQKTKDDDDVEDGLIRQNIQMSNRMDDLANELDVYLTGKDISKESNKTTITLSNRLTWKEGGEFEYKPHLDLKLHLPNLEKKWQLRFTSYDEESEDRGINANRLQTDQRREQYGASIAFFRKLGDVDVEFRPRIELDDVSHILSFESKAELGDFRLTPRFELFARSDQGTGEFFGIDLDYLVNEFNLLTLINEEQYTDGDNLFTTNHGLRWNHRYNKRTMQSTSLIYQFVSQPQDFRLERYTLSTTFQNKIYKNILHFELTPYAAYPRDKNFSAQTGLTFDVLLIF